jgi:4-amino-4-deoxy-L-arabinose transferase-like glycosyltransferase
MGAGDRRRQLVGTDVFYQAPLYPYFLGAIYATLGRDLTVVRMIQAIVGAAACTILGLAAARLFGRRAGLVAGLGLALYAPAIFFDGLIQKTVLDVFFVCLVLWISSRLVDRAAPMRTWLCLGLALGGLVLTRENALILVAIVLAWIGFRASATPLPSAGPKNGTRPTTAKSRRAGPAPGPADSYHFACTPSRTMRP